MRKIILYIAMSLDGYIADETGGVAWLEGDGSGTDSDESYSQFIRTVDTVILGYKTYHQVVTELSPDVWVYSGLKSYVITHKEMKSTDDIIFTDKDPKDLIYELKEQPGKDIWICGGASIANELMKFHLIDRYHITIIPTILGKGIRLFQSDIQTHKLLLKSCVSNNGMIEAVYEPNNHLHHSPEKI